MNIQWIILVALILVIWQAWMVKKWVIKNLDYNRFFNVSYAFEGQEIEMIERISNRKLLPVPWLRIESKISADLEFQKQFNLDIKHQQFHKSIFSLMPYTAINRRHRIRCGKRGYYKLNSAALTCGDMFGFQNITKTYDLDAEISIYPRLTPMEEIPSLIRGWMGDVVVKRWIIEDPFMNVGVREYTPRDPMKDINWKATARTGKFQVHNRDFTANPKIMIYLNMDISEDMWGPITNPELIEKGISYAASISQYAIAQGIDTGFGSNGYLTDNPERSVRVLPKSGEEHLFILLETMARLIVDRRVTFHTFLEEEIDNRIWGRYTESVDYLFITPFITQRIQDQINLLKAMGNSVEVLWLQDGGGEVFHEGH